MVRIGGDGSSRKSARHVRYDDIPTNTFTPRTYQVELLESALHGNTIACLGSESSKIFLGLMVIKEMSHQIRAPLEEGGKRSVYLADSEDDVESLWLTMYHHTDLAVGKVSSSETDLCSAEQWTALFSSHNILVLSASIFLHCLDNSYLPLTSVNLLVLNNCHKAVGGHAFVGIMSHITNTGESAPHLLCLTAAILGSECNDPVELASKIATLESTLHSKAETSMLVISERFGCRPVESVVECKADDDVTGMGDELASILYTTWHFLEDSQFRVEDQPPPKYDPLHVPKFAISECINILQTLGSWCAASIAENLISQMEKIVKHESDQMVKLFLRYTLTQLRLVVRTFEIGFTPEYEVDELLKYTTPKVKEFINILRKYKPEMDFMIITREGEDGDAVSDLSDDDGNDDDSLDLSSSDEEEEKSKPSKHIHIAVKKKVEKGDADNPFEDEKKLSGLVFVDNRYVAFALNKMLEEVCSWDENLCFVKSSYITGQGIHRPDGRKDLSNASRKQEEILRRFRMQERNLLVSTNVLEEGVDIPKCNLVIRFDPPKDYRSYTLSKGRARARDAEYVILVDEDLMETFSEEIQVFKGIEQVLIGAGRGRQDLEDAQEVQQQLSRQDFTPLPSFSPLNQPGSAVVSMKNSIALVNRYCAKLPSDAFTHLTPHCRLCPSPCDPAQYVAYLRLPVNSPIKEELMGAEMPSRQLAKMAVALQMCELLYKAGELDSHLQPVGKEMFVCEEEEEWGDEEEEGTNQARPGTTKRKQYYIKKPADAFVGSHPQPAASNFLYHVTMTLTGPITEDQNTRGRKIYAPEESTQSFGLLLSSEIPHVPSFPVYTRSGEVTVSLDLLDKVRYSCEELEKLVSFHQFVFSSVLHLEKDPMVFEPETADIGFLVVPLNQSADSSKLDIEWDFVEKANISAMMDKRSMLDDGVFAFKQHYFEDAVVMPSYRNIDQPQHFYVAEIRTDLSPLSPFPSPELYKTFAAYYTTKYGLTLTNMDQPLLDVDHTSARLNLLTPRYMNQKGRALPTSSQETKRARRENLQQKQILVPELCDIHVFSASLWRKAVCLPAILYRMNYLLLAEELRKLIAGETGIGKVNLQEGFKFPRLDFGFETNPEKLQIVSQKTAADGEEPTGDPNSGEAESKQEKMCPAQDTDSRKELCNTEPNSRGSTVKQTEQKQCVSVKTGGSTGRKDAAVHDSSPDDDKTDTGASSDSDSGVVLSESDTNCAVSVLSANRVQIQANPCGLQRTVIQEASDRLDWVCVQATRKETSSAQNVFADETLVDLSSAIEYNDAKSCDIPDAFYTPSTSVPSSPEESDCSDSDESIYEDASDTACGLTPRDSPRIPRVCEADTVCEMDKLSTPKFAPPFPSSEPSVSAALSPTSLGLSSELSTVFSSPTPETRTSPSSASPSPSSFNINAASSKQSQVLEERPGKVAESNSLQSPLMNGTTDLCSQSQKVPGHRASQISCQPSETQEESAAKYCAINNPDLSVEGHNSRESHPEIWTEDLTPSVLSCQRSLRSQLTDHDAAHLNHSLRSDCDDCITRRPGQTLSPSDSHAERKTEEKIELCEDCDDVLDVTGTGSAKKPVKTHTVTFPVDPEISTFTKPSDEVKLTFDSTNNMPPGDLDANWANASSTAALSGEDWAPDEHLTTFEVQGDFSDLSGQTTTDVFNENPPQESKLHSEMIHNEPKDDDISGSVNQNDKHGEILIQPQKASTEQSCVSLNIEGENASFPSNATDAKMSTDSAQNESVLSDEDAAVTGNKADSCCLSEEEEKQSEEAGDGEQSEWGREEQSEEAGDGEQSEWGREEQSEEAGDGEQSEWGREEQSEEAGDGEQSEWGREARDPSEWITLEKPYRQAPRDHPFPQHPATGSGRTDNNTPVSGANNHFTGRAEDVSERSGEMTNGEENKTRSDFTSAAAPCPAGNEHGEHASKHSEITRHTAAQENSSPLQKNQESTTSKEEAAVNHTASTNNSNRFDIGTWNTGQKAKSDGPIVVEQKAEEEAVVESQPLLISLDQDTDLETFMGPSPCLLLQALTMSNANDFFSLERLETIGDSFLKYAITVYLYCCYPGTHEGKLSYLRSKQVSNYNLYRLGRRKCFAERMVSTKFEPYENWLPPGYIISESRRRGPVPKVVIATCSPRLSAVPPVNFVIEEEESESGLWRRERARARKAGGEEDQKKETAAFHAMVEEIDRQQAVDHLNDISSSHKHTMVPYCLQLHHGIPDKSVADCVEGLIGCYLTTCGKQAALTFMSWLGLKVLPRKRAGKQRKKGEEVKMTEFQELQCPPSPLLRSVPEAESLLHRLLEGFCEFEDRIQYTFRDRSYLLQAFTHASYHYNYITDCYQRLEFLGDAILDYVITRHLYEDSQRYSPGILTDLRSALVNNNIFAALAVKWDFHKFFKAISPSLFVVIDKFVMRQKEREDQIDEIEEVKKPKKKLDTDEEDEDDIEQQEATTAAMADGPAVNPEGDDDTELEIPKALGDIFESVAGAIYLDSGMSLDAVWRVYYRMMKPHIDKYLKDIPKSPVRELLEMEPETAKFEKPERTLDGKIRVTVNVVGKGVFYGVGRNYRIAKSAAAKKALRFIRSMQMEGLA